MIKRTFYAVDGKQREVEGTDERDVISKMIHINNDLNAARKPKKHRIDVFNVAMVFLVAVLLYMFLFVLAGCEVAYVAGWRVVSRETNTVVDQLDIHEYDFRVACRDSDTKYDADDDDADKVIFENKQDKTLKIYDCSKVIIYRASNSCGRIDCSR